MRRVVLVLFLAACDPSRTAQDAPIVVDDTAIVDDVAIVAPIDDAPAAAACNPLAAAGMQGCGVAQKCSWITLVADGNSANSLGVLGCVPDGAQALGAACTQGAPGSATGYDTCAAGAYCIDNTCQDICGFNGVVAGACAAGSACTRYASVFANGNDDPPFGICNPACDPLAQTCGANKGCYLLSSDTGTVAVCAGAGNAANVHNVEIRASGATTPVYVNSCAPGFMPRAAMQGDGAAVECGGFCKPADVYDDTPASGTTAAQAGMNDGRSGRPNYEGGDTTVMNWMNQPATCVNAAGGAGSLAGQAVDPSNPTTGEACQYYYMSERFPGISDYSNSVGLCFQVRQWRFDGTPPTDGSTPTPDTAWTSCRDLDRGAPLLPAGVTDGAAFFGCTAVVPAMLVARTAVRRGPLQLDRLAPPAR